MGGYDMRELIERACKYVNVIPYTNFNLNDYRALVNYIDKTHTNNLGDFQTVLIQALPTSCTNGNKVGK